MATIQVGGVKSYAAPTEWGYTPDDRQQLVPLIGGNTVEDYGHIASGDRMNCTALFRKADFQAILGYWEARARVTVTDESGNTWSGCRVLVKGYKYSTAFPQYVEATLEFWRI